MRVFNSAPLQVAPGTTFLTFDSERFDFGGFHIPGPTSSRLTVPPGGAGLYQITANLSLSFANASNVMYAQFHVNGGVAIGRDGAEGDVEDPPEHTLNPTTLYRLEDGFVVELAVVTNINATILADEQVSPEFMMVRVATSVPA